jgi:hypothetical protein
LEPDKQDAKIIQWGLKNFQTEYSGNTIQFLSPEKLLNELFSFYHETVESLLYLLMQFQAKY